MISLFIGVSKASVEQDIINKTNLIREVKWLQQLQEDSYLDKMAKAQCAWVNKTQIWSHDRPWMTYNQRVNIWFPTQTLTIGENQWENYVSAYDAVTHWWRSSDHRKNLIYPTYKYIWVAVVWNVMCQEFASDYE